MKIEFPEQPEFVETKAHSLFVEFAQSCIENRYIGVCHGRPGVGKTRSASEFAKWPDTIHYRTDDKIPPEIEAQIRACRAIFITARVSNSPKMIEDQLSNPMFWFGHARMRVSGEFEEPFMMYNAREAVPLVIVDEADRLSLKGNSKNIVLPSLSPALPIFWVVGGLKCGLSRSCLSAQRPLLGVLDELHPQAAAMRSTMTSRFML